jgi:hypothetical protein
MNNKIVIAASIGLSLFAAAQSQTDKPKTKPSTTQTQNPRDLATGQSSGRTEQKAIVHRDLATRDAASGQATGKTMASDDWQQRNAVSTGTHAGVKPVASSSGTNAQPRVATGDVNGDGVADAASSRSSAHATESIVQNPRDVATGQMSGKRQHQPVTVTKRSEKQPNQ